MRNGCLPNIRNISLWRKSEKVEMADGETKEVSRQSHEKRVTEEIRIREYVDGKSQINDSSTSINDGSLLGKEVIHAKPRDSSAENKISTHAKQASTQDQANTRKEYKRAVDDFYLSPYVPVRGAGTNWKITSITSVTKGGRHERLNDEFNKVKSFDLRGVQTLNDGFNKVKSFDLRGVQTTSSTASLQQREENQLVDPDFFPVK